MDAELPLNEKEARLKAYLKELGSVAVAFSAGVDSALLLVEAHEVLGDKAVAFTAFSPANPLREQKEAIAFCEERGIAHQTFEVDELQIEGFAHNPANRCFLCKQRLFAEIIKLAGQRGIDSIVEGSNVDDLSDYRPGQQALAELGIKSPLMEAGFTKQDIRNLAREKQIPQWDKPSFACLYSRFPYDVEMTREKLRMVDEAEQFLLDEGFTTVRVRLVEDVARIELIGDEISRAAQSPLREKIVDTLKSLGFKRVTLDLQGYRTGSMNEGLGAS